MDNFSFPNPELALKRDFFPFLQKVRESKEFVCKTFEETEEFKGYLSKMMPLFMEIPSIEEIEIIFKENLVRTSQKKYGTHKKKWNISEKKLLAWTVFYYMKLNQKKADTKIDKNDWKVIGHLLNKPPIECLFKYNSLKTSHIQEMEWSTHEDETLFMIVRAHQKLRRKFRWSEVARIFYENSNSQVFRNEKICREHWISYLDPSLNKEPWTEEEDFVLMKQYLRFRSKWTEISKNLKGRNIYSIKNRLYSICSKHKIPKNKKTIEEGLRKLVESKEPVRKKIHTQTSSESSSQENASCTNSQDSSETFSNIGRLPCAKMPSNLVTNLYSFYFSVQEKPKEEFGSQMSGFYSERPKLEENVDKYFAF